MCVCIYIYLYIYIYIYVYIYAYIYTRFIGLVDRVFASGPGALGSITPKTFKMVLDNSLLNTQQYKVRIKGKV